jgi:poly-gamma-glutamate synthesis protein (capsule biosynthesis protein)
MEVYNGTPIFYSLGNFVFDQYFSQDTQEGLGIGMIIENEAMKLYLLPYAISASQPILMEGDAKTVFLEKFISWGQYDEDMKSNIRNGKLVLPPVLPENP